MNRGMVMNHDVAVRDKVVERYLLNELDDQERDEFEEHFFDCRDCAESVRAGLEFIEQSKTLLVDRQQWSASTPPLEGGRAGWFGWLRPAFVIPTLALLLGLVAYQNLVTYPRLRQGVDQPQILPSAVLTVGPRGASRPSIVAPAGGGFLLFVRIPREDHFLYYIAELYDPAGKKEWSVTMTIESADDQWSMFVPGAKREPGTYTLVVNGIGIGAKKTQIGQTSFQLEIQKSIEGSEKMETLTETSETTQTQDKHRSHQFHGAAHVLSGELQGPIKHTIDEHAPVAMKDERGGHLKRVAQDVSVEGLISFKSGHSRISGYKSPKHQGWVTLSTSVMEGLNVFEVITADRLVAQVATEHPYVDGHVPHVTFLGTRYENLQVGGFPLTLSLDLDLCGRRRPNGDQPYLTDGRFLGKIQKQVASVANADFLPQNVKREYDERLAEIEKLIESPAEVEKLMSRRTASRNASARRLKVTCSLVDSIDIKDIPIPGLETAGNVLFIPDFGAVALAEVEVGVEQVEENGFKRHSAPEGNGNEKKDEKPPISHYFNLKMIDMTLGCVGQGKVIVNNTMVNGNTKP